MKDDLADALIPVFWTRDHVPVLQERLLNWQRRYPYEVIAERDPVRRRLTISTSLPNPFYSWVDATLVDSGKNILPRKRKMFRQKVGR
jgi:hypothetical protein